MDLATQRSTYRIAPAIPYLIAAFAPLGLAVSLISPRISLADYVLGFGFAALMVGLAVLARRYCVVLETDKLIVSALRRAEYPLAEVVRLEVGPARGGAVAALTLRDGRQVVLSGYLQNFSGLVQALRSLDRSSEPGR
jgi:hypothetical protein